MDSQPVELFYEEYGQGIPMVLLHGYPLDHTIWEPIVPFLKDHARLILPDLRGHGRSPAPQGEYTMRLMADDVMALLKKLKLGCAIIVGHSMGGYASLALALSYPQHISALALVASHAAADTPERRQNRYNQAEKIARKGASIVAENMSARLTANPDISQVLHNIIMKTPTNGFVGSLRGMAERPDLMGKLSKIQAPAVVMAGLDDQIMPKELPETTAQLLGRAWLLEIQGAGHVPMMETPRIVADALLQLIQAAEGCSHIEED
jgi:3-oxoadipate enol-lactonase